MTNDLIDRAKAAPDGMFLIEKRGLYYRPDAAGYTGIKDEAGRYSFEDAAFHAGPNGPDGSLDGITIWAEADAPDYSPACYSDIKEKHMRSKLISALEARDARIAELERERNGLIAKSLENEIMREAAEAKHLEAEQCRMEAAERVIALEDDVGEFRAVNADLEARVKKLEVASENLIRIVEGIEGAMTHGTWRAEKSNLRMKDTEEWTQFYCAVRGRTALEGEK